MAKIKNLVIVSDLHCGCRLGLHPLTKTPLDDGGFYEPSALQKEVCRWWWGFWDQWVPEVCHGEPFAVLVNGDTIDGVHHNSTTQVSHNINDQIYIAKSLLAPVVDACKGHFYMIRGTEVHVGQSGKDEDKLAQELGAIPDKEGRFARWELWAHLGKGLVHAMHHIGTTGSQAYESTAVMKELTEAYTEAGRWSNRPPDIVVRSHRHRNIEVRVPTGLGYGISLTTPAWQLKTPFSYKIPGARQAMPQIGGIVIRQGDQDLYTRSWVKSPKRSKAVEL